MGCGSSAEGVSQAGGGNGEAYTPSEPAPAMEDTDAPPRPAPQRKRRASVSAEPTSSLKDVEKKVIPKTDEEKAAIQASITASFLFSGLEEEAITDIVNAMFEKQVYADDVIIAEGDEGDNFYIVENGTYVAYKGGQEVFTYNGKGTFGELALMYNCPRAATVKATTNGRLWCVDRITFQGLIVVGMRERRQKQEQTLATMTLFANLTNEDRAVIADCLLSEIYEDGSVIIAQGDAVDSTSKFYIVETGSVVCTRSGQVVKEVGPGGFFGELAIITDEPRAATCSAKGKTRVFAMGRDAFERLMGPVKEVFAESAEEYKKTNAELSV